MLDGGKMKTIIIHILLAIVLVTLSWATVISRSNETHSRFEQVISKAEHNESLGVTKVALDHYLEAINLRPEDQSLYHKYMDLAYADERYPAFENMARRTIAQFPKDQYAYYELTKYYFERDQYSRVIHLANSARENLENADAFREMYFTSFYQYRNVSGTFDEVSDFVGRYALVSIDNQWGILTREGRYLITPQYEFIGMFAGGKAPVVNEGKAYFVNSQNEMVFASSDPVDKVYPYINGLAVAQVGDLYGYANASFDIVDLQWDFATSYMNNVAAVKKDGKWALRDFERNLLTEFIFDDVLFDEHLICSNQGVIFVKHSGQYYLVNSKGERITDIAFDDAKPMRDEGIAAVKKDGKWGFVNLSGEIVIDFKYEDADGFNLGIAPVRLDGKWFYIDRSEVPLIEGNFSEARSFSSSGLAAVKHGDNWGFIQLLMYR